MKKVINISLMFLLIVGFLSIPVKAQDEPKWCPLCGMNLKMYWKSNHRLSFTDGSKTQTCSIHCAALIHKDRAKEIVKWEAVDYETEKFIGAKKASFLIGSKLPGTMTAVSKLAFASLEVAKKYQKEKGGTIGTFDDALNRALADIDANKEMMMKRVSEVSEKGKKLAYKHGCYNCHGEGGEGGEAPAWNTPEFAQEMDSRVKIKEAILGGIHKMPPFENKISEKDLHAITLYIWTLMHK